MLKNGKSGNTAYQLTIYVHMSVCRRCVRLTTTATQRGIISEAIDKCKNNIKTKASTR